MDDRARGCAEPAVLLSYAAGALSSEESARVAGHLPSCPRCREVVGENEALAAAFTRSTLSRSHPGADLLVRLSEGVDLGPGEARLREHVSECEECRRILLVLDGVSRDLAAHEERLVTRLGQRITRIPLGWAWTPAAAYLLAALLLYPAYQGLFGQRGSPPGEAAALLTAPVALPSGAERGPHHPPIRVHAGVGRVLLTFFVPVAADGFRYQVTVSGPSGNRLFSDSDARSFDRVGTFALVLADLSPGAHEVLVEEIDRASGNLAATYRFPFQVERR